VIAPDSITIRPCRDDDAGPLARLAAVDSARVPAGDLLVAEAEGQLRAAVSLADGATIADPFHPTAELVELLRLRARRSAVELRLTRGRRLLRALAARR
jgi:hypothetical protein